MEEIIRGSPVSSSSQLMDLWVHDLDSVIVRQPIDIGVCLTFDARKGIVPRVTLPFTWLTSTAAPVPPVCRLQSGITTAAARFNRLT